MDNTKIKYVGLPRRLIAYSLDYLFYGGIFIYIQYFYLYFETFFPHAYDHPWPLLISESSNLLYIFLAFAILFDHIGGPVLWGCTFTRWICGYQIKQKNGENPNLRKSLVRFFSLWIIETISIGLITFITSIFRKDKAAVHDLLSKTRAVFPDKINKYKFLRLVFIVVVPFLSLSFSLNFFLFDIYSIKIMPTKYFIQKNLQEEIASKSSNQGAYQFKGISILTPTDKSRIHICLREVASDNKYYFLYIDNSKFGVIRYEKFNSFPFLWASKDDVFEEIDTLQEKIIVKLGKNFLEKYPFFEPAHVIAQKNIDNIDMDLSLFTPVQNIEYFMSNLFFIISIPPLDTYRSIPGDGTYAYTSISYKPDSSDISSRQVTIFLFGKEKTDYFILYPKERSEETKIMLYKIFKSIQIIGSPDIYEKEPEICKNFDQSIK